MTTSTNTCTPFIKKSKTTRSLNVKLVRNTLSSLAEMEVRKTPEFKVTYIENKKPRIVRAKSFNNAC
jgi:hypothetical protein